MHVISTVESWLAMDGVGSATLTIGDRSYTMVGATGDAPSGRAA